MRTAEPAARDVGLWNGQGDTSEVEVRLTRPATKRRPSSSSTRPSSRKMWDQYGPGAVGVGWDMGMLGLTLHLTGGSIGDPLAWQESDEGREFATRSSRDGAQRTWLLVLIRPRSSEPSPTPPSSTRRARRLHRQTPKASPRQRASRRAVLSAASIDAICAWRAVISACCVPISVC